MKVLPLAVILGALPLLKAQTSVDSTQIEAPADGLDFEGCYDDLFNSDLDGDGFVKHNEFLNFINTYGVRICHWQPELTDPQRAAFNGLACICERQEGASPDCCLGKENARIVVAGSNLLPSQRTDEQNIYLRTVCTVTDGTISGECPPALSSRETPPPVIITPVISDFQAPPAGLDGLEIFGIVAGSIAAALLLLLCCCCLCVLRRRRAKALEEEEEQENIVVTKIPPGMEMHPDDAKPRGMETPDEEIGVPFAGGVWPQDEDQSEYIEEEESDSDESGSGRGRRGQNFIEDEDDKARRFEGEGPLPDPGPAEQIVLRPIPDPEPEEDPEWDQPGRHFDNPKDEDEMSAQEFDPYIPDGGVHDPQRPEKKPVDWKRSWERTYEDDPDDIDNRKHRIQSGLGEGEVWAKLDEAEEPEKKAASDGGVFDWVVQSALGALDKTDGDQASPSV